MKTIVVARHEKGGPGTLNGYDGCHARWGTGVCPGHERAEWLNSLGDDDTPFGGVTAGKCRDNWLKEDSHIVAKDPYLAGLYAEKRRLSAELRQINRHIKSTEQQVA